MIKLIATDMDGTWLRDDKTYDQELFRQEFALMQQRGIKFVVASGNQFENIYQRFPALADQIYFIAENGALVAQGRQVLHTACLSPEDWQTLLTIIARFDEKVTVSGLASAYALAQDGQEYAEELKQYYAKLTIVNGFQQLTDQIFKVTFDVPEKKLPRLIAKLRQDYPQLGFVSGSATSIDMSTKGMNKAVGLAYLSQKFKINPREMIAFGDSGNDVGMFKYVGQSFATSTALSVAKKAATRIIGASNDSAVQQEIWRLLNS